MTGNFILNIKNGSESTDYIYELTEKNSFSNEIQITYNLNEFRLRITSTDNSLYDFLMELCENNLINGLVSINYLRVTDDTTGEVITYTQNQLDRMSAMYDTQTGWYELTIILKNILTNGE